MIQKNSIRIRYTPKAKVVSLCQKDRRDTVMEISCSYKDMYEILRIYLEDDKIEFINEARDKYKKIKETLKNKSVWDR